MSDGDWPEYSGPLAASAGGLLGCSLSEAVLAAIGATSWLLCIVTAGLGVILAAWWWFGIASDAACARRHEKARRAAIHLGGREASQW